MGKLPAFKNYEDFLNYCASNRKWAIKLLSKIGRYTPFIFGDLSERDGLITICAGYRIITDLSKLLKPRVSSEYKAWKKAILNRDDFKCKSCGSDQNLHIHHIEPVKTNIKKITDLNNGITLCNKCHRKIHTNV